MNTPSKSFIYQFGLYGLLASLGAPIGFYIHAYLIKMSGKENFWEHVAWLNQHEVGTLIYIGIGTSIFFSIFGCLIGKYVEDNSKVQLANYQLKQAKLDLTKHFLTKMRVPVSVGLEYLLHLKVDSLPPRERDELLHYSINELNKLDESVRVLMELHSHLNEDFAKITGHTAVDTIKKSLAKKYISVEENHIVSIHENYNIKLKGELFSLILDQFLEWVENNELVITNIKIGSFNFRHKEFFKIHKEILSIFPLNSSIVCFEFNIAEFNNQDFDAPMLIDIVGSCNGICYKYKDSVLIVLPAEDSEVEERAGAA